MTIFEHPMWETILPFLYIRRGFDGVNGARHRIEVNQEAPRAVFDIRVSCAHCGAEITPVRRDARGAWTFNLSCPLSVDMRCARMPETTAACSLVRDAIAGRPRPVDLFS